MTNEQYIERYWRDATPQDAIREPPMVARFRDEHYKDWVIDKLIFWDRSEVPWHRDDGYCYERCQVYDAPDPGEGWRLIDPEKESPEEGDEFFEHGYWKTRRAKTDPFAKTFYYRRRIQPPKPEPGEGWRLIDPEKDKPQEGDEYREKWDVAWKPRNELSTTLFAPETFYRRRIEQPKPEPRYEPFRWEDREQLRGRWVYRIHANGTRDERMLGYAQQAANGDIEFGGFFPDTLVREWKFLDTGEPVGRKIQ